MNADHTACPIWETSATFVYSATADGPHYSIDSPRAGGRYCYNPVERAEKKIADLDDHAKARLTTWLIEQRRLGHECPEIRSYEIESIIQRPALSVHDRADELLKYIQKKTLHIGRAFLAGDFLPDMFAYTESVDSEELQYLTDYLIRKGWLETSTEATIALIVTVEGYTRLAELAAVVVASSQAFRGHRETVEACITKRVLRVGEASP